MEIKFNSESERINYYLALTKIESYVSFDREIYFFTSLGRYDIISQLNAYDCQVKKTFGYALHNLFNSLRLLKKEILIALKSKRGN